MRRALLTNVCRVVRSLPGPPLLKGPDARSLHALNNQGEFFFNTDVCRECSHVIAVHQYTFSVVEDYQVYYIEYWPFKPGLLVDKYFSAGVCYGV